MPTDFSFGAVVPVSITFDLDNGIAGLTAGGNTVFDLSLPANGFGQLIDGFGMRQTTANNAPHTIVLNNLIVSYDVPEPSTYALLLGALGLVVVMIRRRR